MSENTPHTPDREDLPTAEDWADINSCGASACSLPGGAEHDEPAPSTSNDEATAPSSSDTDTSSAEDPTVASSPTNAASPTQDAAEACAEAELGDLEDPLADSELANALARVDELEDKLAHAKADYYNLNTEYGNYVRRAKEAIPGYKTEGHVDVLEALISVLDDIDAARQAGDLAEGPFASIAHKLEETLAHRFGLTRYGVAGEDFDPMLHEALMARPNPNVDHQVIGQVLQPGYTMHERTLRVAKVLVDTPE